MYYIKFNGINFFMTSNYIRAVNYAKHLLERYNGKCYVINAITGEIEWQG